MSINEESSGEFYVFKTLENDIIYYIDIILSSSPPPPGWYCLGLAKPETNHLKIYPTQTQPGRVLLWKNQTLSIYLYARFVIWTHPKSLAIKEGKHCIQVGSNGFVLPEPNLSQGEFYFEKPETTLVKNKTHPKPAH